MPTTTTLHPQVMSISIGNLQGSVASHIPPAFNINLHPQVQAVHCPSLPPRFFAGIRHLRCVNNDAQTIYGITPGPFRLALSTRSTSRQSGVYGKRSKVHLVYDGRVKPEVATVFVKMALINFTHRLEIGEYLYQTPNHVLTIINAEVVDEVLIEDDTIMGGTNAIPVQQIQNTAPAIMTLPIPPIPIIP